METVKEITAKGGYSDISLKWLEILSYLDVETLQIIEDKVMRTINIRYGDFIEDNLRNDPEFSHLFEKDIKIPESSSEKSKYRKPVMNGDKCLLVKQPNKVENKAETYNAISNYSINENPRIRKQVKTKNSSHRMKNIPKSKMSLEGNELIEKNTLIQPNYSKSLGKNSTFVNNAPVLVVLNPPHIENPFSFTEAKEIINASHCGSLNLNENIHEKNNFFANMDLTMNCEKKTGTSKPQQADKSGSSSKTKEKNQSLR
ncbi:hypothetical protein HHI36_022050 [Cryptolaemus montrouzieri]|uniref:Uncharacterized protein n=1 Tax=Cryptolaemus montrouzieri TaxID=559131 RepID=A0ABD2MYK5_9CUCU